MLAHRSDIYWIIVEWHIALNKMSNPDGIFVIDEENVTAAVD